MTTRRQFSPRDRRLKRSLLVLLALAALVLPWRAGTVSAEERPVRAVECGEATQTPEGLRLVEVVERGEAAAEVRSLVLPAAELSWLLAVEEGEEWELSLAGDGFWSQAVRVSGSGEGGVTVPFWGGAEVVGRVRVPRGETVPEALALRLSSARAASKRACAADVVVACPIGEEGELACPVPAGRWNLRARAAGWAARYLWDVDLGSAEPVYLGVLRLRRGTTVVGQVTTVEGPVDPESASVRLTPSAVVEPGARSAGQREELALEARVAADGQFAIEGVPHGTYVLVARQPGFSPARVFPLEVRLDRETILRPLLLEREARLRVEVEPPRTISGAPWEVRIFEMVPEGGSADLVDQGPVDEEGTWTSRPLPVGRYDVSVEDAEGSIFGALDGVELRGGSLETLSIPLDLVEVAGTVLLGDEPLAATLWFGGRSGVRRVEITADEEGRFAGFLPGGGEWTVDVLAEDPPVSAKARRVEIDESGEDDLEIRVPDTAVAGEVVDAAGLPVAAAVSLVATEGARQLSQVRSKADGSFEILGLEEGAYWVEAEGEGKRSDRVSVAVAEDAVTPFVRLVLRSQSVVEGRVVSADGPVLGAMVLAIPLSEPGQLLAMSLPDATTDATGRFELRLPGETARMVLIVLPPGHALTVMRAEPGDLSVWVEPPAGALFLEGAVAPAAGSGGEIAVLMVDGVPVDQGMLIRWADINGVATTEGGLTVPAMAAGDYAYCALELAEALAVLAGHALPIDCSTGFLTAGGTLNLQAP